MAHIGLMLRSLTGGGAERSVLVLAEGLVTRGHKVDLVFVTPPDGFHPKRWRVSCSGRSTGLWTKTLCAVARPASRPTARWTHMRLSSRKCWRTGVESFVVGFVHLAATLNALLPTKPFSTISLQVPASSWNGLRGECLQSAKQHPITSSGTTDCASQFETALHCVPRSNDLL
ncbi:MAG: hypothetical protein OXE57_06865, partial [Alphaproteobacteria bacterium]|nr:hypothetical protein [Alphaproteobacteria bacterium]